MPSGGARNRSGPPPDPNSGRSDARGLSFEVLPAEGYRGRIPKFPLPNQSVREAEVWKWAWRTPQADAWAREPWRQHVVALWVRWSVRTESDEATAAEGNLAIRYADQIGLTPAGMRENGWTVSTDELASRRKAAAASAAPAEQVDDPRDRLRAVDGGA